MIYSVYQYQPPKFTSIKLSGFLALCPNSVLNNSFLSLKDTLWSSLIKNNLFSTVCNKDNLHLECVKVKCENLFLFYRNVAGKLIKQIEIRPFSFDRPRLKANNNKPKFSYSKSPGTHDINLFDQFVISYQQTGGLPLVQAAQAIPTPPAPIPYLPRPEIRNMLFEEAGINDDADDDADDDDADDVGF